MVEAVLTPEGYNLLMITALLCFVAWLFHLCRSATALSDLRMALSSERLLRLDGLSLHLPAVESLTGAHLQQLLRTRQAAPAVDVNAIVLPFDCQRTKLSVQRDIDGAEEEEEDEEAAAERKAAAPWTVKLTYTSRLPFTATFLWGLSSAATRMYEDSGRHALRGSAVDSLEAVSSGRSGGLDAAVGGDDDAVLPPLFPRLSYWQAGGAAVQLPAGKEVEVVMPLPPQLLTEGEAAFPLIPPSEGSSDGTPAVWPLAVIASLPEDAERAELLSAGDGVVEQQVSLFTFGGSSDSLSLSLARQLNFTATDVWLQQEVFGLEDAETDDCVVCLCEPKAVVLLPCRHMCTCADCFLHVSKCPVCRSPFETYMQFKPQDDAEAGAARASEASIGALEEVRVVDAPARIGL
eukprot:PLAT10037.1.p2 GENE.PLAT10037.1~~PLAT10037.1.p2  ORF type:complete len:406 (+),score=208.11 PLAT10037.1:121-1338(+)